MKFIKHLFLKTRKLENVKNFKCDKMIRVQDKIRRIQVENQANKILKSHKKPGKQFLERIKFLIDEIGTLKRKYFNKRSVPPMSRGLAPKRQHRQSGNVISDLILLICLCFFNIDEHE